MRVCSAGGKVRSVGGGDPKLKVALPAWSIDPLLKELKDNRERVETKVRDIERDKRDKRDIKRDMVRDRQRRRRERLKTKA